MPFFFVKKLKILCSLDHTILFKFHKHVYKHFLRNVWRDFRLPMSALATVAGKSFNGKFTPKMNFRSAIFNVTISVADIGSLKSPLTWFHKYLDPLLGKLKQNRMVETVQNFELYIKKCSPFLTTYWRHFGRHLCDWNNCLMLIINLKSYHLSMF